VVTAANVDDTILSQAVVAAMPPIRTPSGRRRARPGAVHADKGYDSHGSSGVAAAAWDPAADHPA
jgi:hypothetical protein